MLKPPIINLLLLLLKTDSYSSKIIFSIFLSVYSLLIRTLLGSLNEFNKRLTNLEERSLDILVNWELSLITFPIEKYLATPTEK